MIAAVTKEVLRWWNAVNGGGNQYWLQKENEAANDMELALRKHPIWRPKKTPKYFEYPWGEDIHYDPQLDANNIG
jgi:hypothetical protein